MGLNLVQSNQVIGHLSMLARLWVHHHTVPYGTGSLPHAFQAINCLATFIQFPTGQQRLALGARSHQSLITNHTSPAWARRP